MVLRETSNFQLLQCSAHQHVAVTDGHHHWCKVTGWWYRRQYHLYALKSQMHCIVLSKVGTIQNPIQKNWVNPIHFMSNHIHNHNPTFQKGLLSNPIPNPNPKYPVSSLPLRHRYYRLQWHPVTVIVLKWFVYIWSTDHLSDQVILSVSQSLRLFSIAKWMDLDWQSNPSASIPQSL